MSPAATGRSFNTWMTGGGPVSTMSGPNAGSIGPSKVQARALPHLEDLISVTVDVDINSPIRRILQQAEGLAKAADTALDFRRPDVALQEYFKASIIATDIIPRHKDFPSLKISQSELNRTWTGLLKRIQSQQDRFDDAKHMIKEDNKRTGVLPSKASDKVGNGQVRSTNGPKSAQNDKGNITPAAIPNGSTKGASTRKKPQIQPKPDGLHGKALYSKTSDVVDLAGRFARLRSPTPFVPAQDPRIRTQPIKIPEYQETNVTSPPTSQPATLSTSLRPLGPRAMPSAPTAAPHSTKLPLDTQFPGMPKPPDAIYSPSRNPDTAATINFPTSIPRSSSYIGNGNNAAPPVSSSTRTPSFDGRRDYFAPAHRASNNTNSRPDLDFPNSATVTADELVNYLRMGSQSLRLLLIDVRSREEFDEGHVMCPSIICIEPLTLRNGLSAEDIAETLVLSPDSEQRLYEQRDEFDLVIYYDQCSRNLDHSIGDQLPNLVKALYEYGYEKRLKRRPVLLLGGLDAWSDILGRSSLQTSRTGSQVLNNINGNGNKPARPLARVPIARDAYTFAPGRKRTFESRTLSKEEESRWDETLREHPADENSMGVEPESPGELSYIRTTEDFFRRYPELPSIQESMVSAAPARKRVAYNHAPVNSIPQPPTRPAPALPRQRSSGVLEKGPTTSYAMSSAIGIGSAALKPRAGLTGLRNTAVSCYANSIVQCLSATGPLRDFLMNFVPGQSPPVPRKEGELSDPPQLLVRTLGNLLGHLWSGHYDYVAPKTFLDYINAIHIACMPRKSQKNHAFGGTGRQHDASEFLNYMLEILHDETNLHRNRPDYGSLLRIELLEKYPDLKKMTRAKQDDFNHDEATSKLPTEKAIRQEWRRELAADDSIISRVFYGQETFMKRCLNEGCGFVKYRFNSFSAIELRFPPSHTVGPRLSTTPVSMKELFGLAFNTKATKADILPGYKCYNCDKEGSVEDRATTYMPDYLIVNISRFTQVDQADSEQQVMGKTNALVTFTESMDLTSLFLPIGEVQPGTLDRGQVGPFIYDCYAIVNHMGKSLQGGHYTAMTRSLDKQGHLSSQWHDYNDTIVKETTFAASQGNNNVTTVLLKRRQNA